MTKRIKTLIINDMGGGGGMSPEEEAEQIAYYMKELHDIDLDWTHTTALGVGTLDEINPKFIILDYGGAAMGYGNNGYVQVDAVVRWAIEHPSRLLLIYTAYTLYMVDDVMEFEDLPDNILPWDPTSDYKKKADAADRFDYMDIVAIKIRHWYGLPEPEEPDPEDYKLDTPPGRA